MPPVLVATVGAANANSYKDVASADSYFAGRVGAGAWDGSTANEKAAALITGTSRLEQEKYVGVKASPAQRLKWPRTGVTDEDGVAYAADAIPRPVEEALYELALFILANKTTDVFAPTGLEQFRSLKAGSVDLSMNLERTAEEKSGLPPQVLRLLRDLLITYVEDEDEEPGWGHFTITRV